MRAINCSLGKDSCYLIIYIEESNKKARDKGLPEPYPYDDVNFIDTTREFEEMFIFKERFGNYIRQQYNPQFKIKVWRNTKKTFEGWFTGKFTKGVHKGKTRGYPYFTQKNNCWIRRDFKTQVLDSINRQYDAVYIGIAKDEENRQYRKQYQDLKDKGVNVIFPLIEGGITEEQCKEELKKLNILNPLYGLGFTRLGCWDCPYQSIQSLFVLWKCFPEKWAELRMNEAIRPQGFRLEPLFLYEELFYELGFKLWNKEFLKMFRSELKDRNSNIKSMEAENNDKKDDI